MNKLLQQLLFVFILGVIGRQLWVYHQLQNQSGNPNPAPPSQGTTPGTQSAKSATAGDGSGDGASNGGAIDSRMESALGTLENELKSAMEIKLDAQIEQAKQEQGINIINKGGMRRSRAFEKIVQRKKDAMAALFKEDIIEKESQQKCQQNTQDTNSGDLTPEQKKEQLDECYKEALRPHVQKLVTEAVSEGATYLKDNFIIKSSATDDDNSAAALLKKKKMKKQEGAAGQDDPYAGKTTEYITDELRNYEPHIDDLYLILPSQPAHQIMFGEPIEIESENWQRWLKFLKYIEEKNLQPLSDDLVDGRRWGFGIFYLFMLNMPRGSSDEQIFEETYKILNYRTNYKFPEWSPRLQEGLDTGAMYIAGRLSEIGHQPLVVMNVLKMKDLINKKGVEYVKEYTTYIFAWIAYNLLIQGKVERVVLLYDLKGVKVRDFPLKQMYELLRFLEKLFKAGPFRVIFVNQSWFLNKVIEMISMWVDELEKKLLVYANEEDTFQCLLQFMNANEIEQKYGGNKPNINKFYPPVY